MKADELTVNGVRVESADGLDVPGEKAVNLPSGARAVIRTGRGRDLMNAQRASTGKGGTAMTFALIAELARIDGRRIVYEDVLEMDLRDVMALQSEVLGENFMVPPPQVSPGSSDSDSQPEN
ncbi:MAG TPA: hypothetical protein VMU16_15355 [Candidatus Binataceae bacterium]|nr:hypothetical protein [Candidatus Binataceae bacterium]